MLRESEEQEIFVRNSDDGAISLQDLPSQKEGQNDDETPLLLNNSLQDSVITVEYPGIIGSDEDLRRPGDGGNFFLSFLNMANSIIGAGIIGLPYSFKEAGIFTGIILLIVLTIMVDWTIRLLVINSKLSGRSSYQGMMDFCFGKKGYIAISLFQFVFAFGGMCAFCVIIGDTIPNVIKSIFPGIVDIPFLYLFAERNFVIILCTVFISYPLALYRDITNLAKASGLALISMVIIVAAVAIEGPTVDESLKGRKEGTFAFIKSEVFQSIGVISFAFVCHHNSLLIFDALKKPTLNRFAAVTHLSTGMSMVACMVMALVGYLVFTDKTQGNILNNFPDNDFLINVARFCFGFNMFTTLPLESFVINNYFFSQKPFSLVRHVIITTSLVGGAMSVSLLTDDLGIVLEITGGFSATALAYILPPLCFLKLSSGNWLSVKKFPALCRAS
ncbi:4476_t:CDS:10 [Acaulospora morrowiae]|uniref:4476_t:CDS:1 n=1 Tax=Acaulospora morrowiae TaxID=94023 RepID=A0A9N8ZKT6_9GLOM|nr:4476_t:CDS:10 [Acaulospora morrowiae]